MVGVVGGLGMRGGRDDGVGRRGVEGVVLRRGGLLPLAL